MQSLMMLQKFDQASIDLSRLLKKYPRVAELHYLSGEIDKYRGEYPNAITAIERGIALDTGTSAMAYRMLGELHTMSGYYSAAVDSYEDYLEIIKKTGRVSAIEQAEQLLLQARTAAQLAADPYPFTPTPLGPGVNTRESLEYFPTLSIEGSRLIFTRRVNRQREDFYQSSLMPDSSWSEAKPLPGINTDLNEGAQSVSADGKYLVFTGCGRRGGMGSCDLYFSDRIGDRWSEATNLGPAINTSASESQPSLSRDGQLLFFASNRPGGLGGDDLYVSGRKGDGSWSQPVNLGKTINTDGNDRYPFWAADNKTLYFTSTGRPGMGGADLFKTAVNDSNRWEAPVNLGYPINTPGEETNLFIALDGKSAYFSKGVDNDIDIYTFELPEELRPDPATYISVKVVDDATGQPLVATVRLQQQTGRGRVATSTTDRTGRYLTVLPSGVDYGFSVERDGYLFYSDRFTLTGDHSVSNPFDLIIRLQPVTKDAVVEDAEEDGAIVLKNVFFETGSASLLPLSTEELDRLVSLLSNQPEVNVEIAGHTDDVGSEEDNQQLSERRALSVKTYLESQGVRAERISAVGHGESHPVADNDTEEGRARNRRTTFRLLF